MDNTNCHTGTVPGTPNGNLAIITMGDVNGIILPQTAIGPFGSRMAIVIIKMAKMIMSVMGKLSDCASLTSSLMALPMAAYKDE